MSKLNHNFVQDIDDKMYHASPSWANLPHNVRIQYIHGILSFQPLPVAVYGTDPDRHYLLGYAYGDSRDIQAYFDDRKGYGLEFETVNPVYVQEGYADEKTQILVEMEDLQRRLDELKSQLERRQ